jgi:hypothetical protein
MLRVVVDTPPSHKHLSFVVVSLSGNSESGMKDRMDSIRCVCTGPTLSRSLQRRF